MSIENVAALIQPAVEEAKQQAGSLLENAVKDNVAHVVLQLKKSDVLADLLKQKKIGVKGGYYDFTSGKVMLLPVD